jgi:DNA-binding NtrC family response regulator
MTDSQLTSLGNLSLSDAQDSEPRARVLLVDDDPGLLAISADILEQEGYQVTQAYDAESALDLVRSEARFDVLVTDNALPGISGGALLRLAAALRPDLRGLLVTGYGSVAAAEGFPLLRKPFRGAELVAEMRRLADAQPALRVASAAS